MRLSPLLNQKGEPLLDKHGSQLYVGDSVEHEIRGVGTVRSTSTCPQQMGAATLVLVDWAMSCEAMLQRVENGHGPLRQLMEESITSVAAANKLKDQMEDVHREVKQMHAAHVTSSDPGHASLYKSLCLMKKAEAEAAGSDA